MKDKTKKEHKLVLVYSTDPNAEIMGGGTRYMRYLLRQAIKKDMRVKFIGVKLGNSMRDPTGYTFIPLVKDSDKWWRYFIASLFKVPFLKLEPDAIIHTQRLLYLLPYVMFHPSNPKICTSDQPLVAASTVYPYPVYWIMSKLFLLIERYIMKRINVVIAQEDVLRGYYKVRYPDLSEKLKFGINPAAGLNTDVFKPLAHREAIRRSRGISSLEYVIIFVGRLAPVKRIDFLIDSFFEFKKKKTKSRFLIMGRGESEIMLRQHAEKCPDHSIEFLGEKRGKDLVEIYNCADVFVLASKTEGNPTVVREALACGVPVVSTKVGDVGEIIDNQYLGKVVPYEATPNEFAEAMTEVLDLDREKILKTCSKKAFNFSEEEAFNDTYNLYLKLSLSKR